MARPSCPGLGSLLNASESVDVLRCSAGRRSSDAGRGSNVRVPRRSKALFGRRVSFSGDVGRTIARTRGRAGEAVGLGMWFECLSSDVLDVCWPMLVVLRLSAIKDNGCRDFVRDVKPSGEIFGLELRLLPSIEGGVKFSLLAYGDSFRPGAELRTRCEVCCVAGADRSE